MFKWSRSGIRSRSAASLISWILFGLSEISSSWISSDGAEMLVSRTIGVSGGVGISAPGTGAGGRSGTGVGMKAGASTTGSSGNGPFGSPSSPVSPSGTEDGAATGSEKTGSMLVVLVISSIAFCKSLSMV